MDSLASSPQVPKTRREYSRAFKAMVVKACSEPNNSTAGVAQKYQLNASLIHKWRCDFERQPSEHFISLPAPALFSPEEMPDKAVRIELPNGAVSHWPADRMMDSVVWLKAILQ